MLDQRSIIQQTAEHVRALLSGEGTGHDWHHIERVRRAALAIGREEGADLFVVEQAALLHDIADWKFAGGDHEAGPRKSRAWLASLDVAGATIDHVCQIVAGLSFKGAGVKAAPLSLEGQCVQDADRLDELGAIGIARAFAYGGHKGQPLYEPDASPTPHNSFEAYQRGAASTINHFYEKLLLLKDRMNTAAGRRLAAERHRYLEAYLEQFYAEWEGRR